MKGLFSFDIIPSYVQDNYVFFVFSVYNYITFLSFMQRVFKNHCKTEIIFDKTWIWWYNIECIAIYKNNSVKI